MDSLLQLSGVLFRLHDDWFFVDALRVREIIRPPGLSVIAGMPGFVAGVMTYRGATVPVLNVWKLFEPGSGEVETGSRILLLNMPGWLLGIFADEVAGLLALSVDVIQPPPLLSPIASYSIGVAVNRGRSVTLVNIDRLLSSEEERCIVKLVQQDTNG